MAARGSNQKAKAQPETVEHVDDGYLTDEELFATDDLVEQDLTIPEWGGKKVRLKALTKRQQQNVRRRSTVKGIVQDDLYELHMVVEGMIRPKLTPEQVNQLAERSASAIDRIVTELYGMNGLTVEAMEAFEKAFRDAAEPSV